MTSIDLMVDVADAAGLGEPAAMALTVHLPGPTALGDPTVVCFAKPGAGFSRRYFTADLPGCESGSQADWHAARGWVFVSVDHLGVGESTTHHDPNRLDCITLASASNAAEQIVLDRLAAGTLSPDCPNVLEPIVVGLGQSMGGCLTIVQQARHQSYDGIAILGFGAIRIERPAAADTTDFTEATRRAYFFDGIDASFFRFSHEYAHHGESVPEWASETYPGGVLASILTPGVVADEAAAISVPVLIATGERDVVPDVRAEPSAYRGATSIDVFVCPRMAHMHNFAETRALLWRRIELWATWVAS